MSLFYCTGKTEVREMKNYYQLSAEETMKELNGSTEPLTEEQVKEHKEKYGPNELVEGKKKTVLQIFLEQYKDFLVIILIIAAIVSGFMGGCGKRGCYRDRDHDECDPRNRTDCEGRAVACKPEETFRTGGKSAPWRQRGPDPVF